jgi:hypothetical protein
MAAGVHLWQAGDERWRTREFATLDRDGNLVTFFQWVER